MCSAIRRHMATATHPHAIVGVFRSGLKAYGALRSLDRAGLPPQDVSLIAGEPELEAEARAKPHAPKGAVAGAAIGVVVGAAYVILGGAGLFADALGVMLGLSAAVACGIVGFYVGRIVARRRSRWRAYEDVLRDGGAIIEVTCIPVVCDRAKNVLKNAGADRIVDQEPAPRP